MSDRSRREHEVAAILMAAVAGEASPDELSRVNAWIRDDPALSEFVVDLMNQEAWLSWHAAAAPEGAEPPDAAQRVQVLLQQSPKTVSALGSPLRGRQSPYVLAAALLVAIGAALGSMATRWVHRDEAPEALIALDSAPFGDGVPGYVARFVQGTACLWNPETASPHEAATALRTGEALNLLEGLAELQFDWSTGAANIKLEGPAGLVLTAERGASLTRGKVTADVRLADGAFVLGTPNGQVEVSQDASIGVVVRGDAVEVHVFRGAAKLVTSWAASSPETDRLAVAAGQSLTIANAPDGRMRQERGGARPVDFASQISMRSDDLTIPPEYVAEVLRSKPLLYWRFEGDASGAVSNEVGTRYHGRVQGAVQWNDASGNGNVELGTGLKPEELQAYILADEPITEDLSSGYTVEMWIKPSHYHWGTVVSLIGDPPQLGGQSVHGMLFELGGPITFESSIERPGRLRFLHRSPPSADLNTGTSCFSQTPYELRKWQHVTAVKEGAQMRLYVNGELVATGEDPSHLPTGLRVIVGQLDASRLERRFTGQLDELAVYARALDAETLRRRYDLARMRATQAIDARDDAI